MSYNQFKMEKNLFIDYLLLPIMLLFGFIGNVIAIIVLTRKKLHKIGTRLMYIVLFAVDSIYLTQQVIFHLFEN